MDRTSRRITKKQAEKNARRSITWVHVLIAVVAIIECFLLVTFTTFSWIESNSSLVIQNGPESSQIADQTTTKKMDIAKSLTSTINLNYPGNGIANDFAPLNDFFSEVKYFQFSKATSSDGRTIFFPCRNNTYSSAGKYRKGDTIDYNTSYLYFDFIVSNKSPEGANVNVENRDVYFDNAAGYTDIFTVTGDGLNADQKTALTNAMRMSITTQVGASAPSTKIFSKVAYSGNSGYKSIDDIPANQAYAYDENGGAEHTNNRNTWVTTYALEDSVYNVTNNVISAEKLFVAKKNADTKVSFRIWFDFWDPDFRTAFGLNSLDYSDYENSEAAYWNIPDATIGIKFKLMTSGNDLRSIYFDDYTLTNNASYNINHLTDEYQNQNYSVWFYTWQPSVAATEEHPARIAGYYAIQLTRDSRDATHTLWSTNTATVSEMDYLMGTGDYSSTNSNAAGYSGSVADRYKKSYFCYGDFSTKTAVYKWELPAKPVSEDFIFNAYSYMPNSSTNMTAHTWTTNSSGTNWWDCNGNGVKSGVGIWQDDMASTMTLLKFRDMATAVTTTNYNGGSDYQIMNAAAATDNHSHYLVFANNYDNSTIANNFSDDVEKRTAAMYYDSTAQVFKSYVPTGWMTSNSGVSFSYCPGGTFSSSGTTLRWYSGATPASQNDGEYIFTALGYSNRCGLNTLGGIGYTPDFYSNSDGYLKGVGTWKDVELIKFNTELIDSSIDPLYRYFVGIADGYSQGYYAMIPDETNMTFSAYIPLGEGTTTAGVNFARLNAAKSSQDDTLPAAYWYGSARRANNTYSTFYPVNCTGTSTVEYTHGYWNLSVLVDGTYENLIYDTLTDGSGSTYAPVVTPGTKTIDVNGTPTQVNHDSVDYSPRNNYGKLEFSFNDSDWVTVCDDTTDTYSYSGNGVTAGILDHYRFYVSAENENTVYWRWTPYAAYSISFYTEGVLNTGTAADTQFEYTHYVSDATATEIYCVVVEAPNDVSVQNNGGE